MDDPTPKKRIRKGGVIDDKNEMRAGDETTKDVTPALKGRPKAGDYDTGIRSILQTAISIYCAILLGDDPFPSRLQELEWAQSA